MTELSFELDDLAEAGVETIAELLKSEVCVCASSFGKDSTIVVSLAMSAWERARDRGYDPCPLYVIHGDTGVENPAMHTYAREAIEAIQVEADRRGIEIRFIIYSPTLAQSWPVRVIGGCIRPVYANTQNRWCSFDWKLRPANRTIRTLIPQLRQEIDDALLDPGLDDAQRATLLAQRHRISTDRMPVTLVGTRFDESKRRSANMTSRGEDDRTVSEHTDPKGKLVSRTLSPIAYWDGWMVFEWYGMATPDHASPGYRAALDTRPLSDLYRDANEGVCGLMPGGDQSKSACGARTGCWACTAVGNDRSMTSFLADPRYAHLRGLAKLRNWLDAIQDDFTTRRWVTRDLSDDAVLRVQPDGLSAETLKLLLRVTCTLDRREAIRALDFDEALREGQLPDDEYVRQLDRQGKRDFVYEERMRKPQFRVVDTPHIPLIETYWALNGISSQPCEAAIIFLDVIHRGIETEVPEIGERVQQVKVPPPRFVDLAEHDDGRAWGLTGPLTEWMLSATPESLPPLAGTPGVTEVEVDAEKASEYVFDHCVDMQLLGPPAPDPLLRFNTLEIPGRLLRDGTVRIPTRLLSEWERMARRSQLLRRACLYGEFDITHAAPLDKRPKRESADAPAEIATVVMEPAQRDLFAV